MSRYTAQDLELFQSNLAAAARRPTTMGKVITLPDHFLPVSFTILGAPRTKKNHQVIRKRADGTRFIAQGKAHDDWASSAVMQPRPSSLPDRPWNCRALVFRERAVGDLINYLQAIADYLQTNGVISDDKWIVSWDGSRLRKDAERPRVEVTITAMDEP